MNQYPCTESRAEGAESRGSAMPATEDHGKTACNASVNVRKVTEHNKKYKYNINTFTGTLVTGVMDVGA